jgi:uncharacterized protein (DUF362 family)
MNDKVITRRDFFKIVGSSSLLLTLPMNRGCLVLQATKVSLVKNPDDSYAIKRAVELAGGFDFLNPGDSVLLKVALNFADPFPATTSPVVVSELIELLKDNGAGDIFVGDRSPSWLDTMYCMQESGIYQAAIDAGAEVVEFADEDMVSVKPEFAIHWPDGFTMPELFNRVDHIISLPTLRAHRLAGFTMGLKNFVGVIHPDDRLNVLHASSAPDFLKMLAEIPLCTDKIRFSLLDAREGWSKIIGYEGGTLITPAPGIIIASNSLVAADVVGVALLKCYDTTTDLLETSVWDHTVIKRSVELFCPYLSYETIQLEHDGVDKIDEIRKNML